MLKVLILAYDFSPYVSIGAQRPESWLQYFPENNIATTIVTRHWNANTKSAIDYIKPSVEKNVLKEEKSDAAQVFRVPFTPNVRDRLLLKFGFNRFVLIRKILSFIYAIGKFFFSWLDETYPIFQQAEKLLKTEKFDFVIATAEPFILFKHASRLSKQFNIPWVADYRDCWTESPVEKKQNFTEKLLLKLFRVLEKRYLSNVAFITTPSPTYKTLLQQKFPEKEVHVVYNGFNIPNIEKLNNISPNNECFEIAYAGILYPHQQLEMFLEGLKLFLLENEKAKVKAIFYGISFYEEMKYRVLNYAPSLRTIIEFTDRLPYEEVLKALKKAHVLLLLSKKNANWLNAKVFDYLALNRAILLVENDKGILENILRNCNTGLFCENEMEVKNQLQYCYQNYFVKKEAFPTAQNFTFFSRQKQATIFCDLLKNYQT